MANIRYFGECNGLPVELSAIRHDGSMSRKPSHFSGRCETCGERHQATRAIEYKSLPSKHECNAKCMSGSSRGKCECRCGGKNHGRGSSGFICTTEAA